MTVQEAQLLTWQAYWSAVLENDLVERDVKKGIKAAMGDRFVVMSAIRRAARQGKQSLYYSLPPEKVEANTALYLSNYYKCIEWFLQAHGFMATDVGISSGRIDISWRTNQ